MGCSSLNRSTKIKQENSVMSISTGMDNSWISLWDTANELIIKFKENTSTFFL